MLVADRCDSGVVATRVVRSPGPKRFRGIEAEATKSYAALRAGAAMPDASEVLGLQRAIGNRAVAGALATRILSRQPVAWAKDAKLAPAEIERLYNKAVAAQDWQLLLAVVNSFAADKDAVRLLRPIQQQGA